MGIILKNLAKRKAAKAEQNQKQREEQQRRTLERLQKDWAVYLQKKNAGWNGLEVPRSYVAISKYAEIDLFVTESAAARFFSDRLGHEVKPWEVEFGWLADLWQDAVVCRCGKFVVIFNGDNIMDRTAIFGELADDQAFTPAGFWRPDFNRSFKAVIELDYDVFRGITVRGSSLSYGSFWKKEEYGCGMRYSSFRKHLMQRMQEVMAA